MTTVSLTPTLKKELTRTFGSAQLKQLVADYLVKRAEAEVLRSEVDTCYREVLSEDDFAAYATLCRAGGDRITENKHLYLCEDEALVNRIYDEVDGRLKAVGIKPVSMERDYCPALVAESELSDIQRNLINCAGQPLNIDAHKLLCNGLETYHKFIDLVVGGALALERETA